MIEESYIERLNWWVDKYSKLIRDNEKQRIAMQHQLDEINTLRGKVTDIEHRNFELSTKLNQQMKENTDLVNTINYLNDEIEKLKEDNQSK